ncbi:receptor-like protein 7 [Hibiscus syriacus]|uniref:receptor-like protein 7 n=1 Tax=Hibiscus syriacus TaxID=106335 RepID=UPI001923EABC|nr:receptor-like protein 7 [Hibiscus syriacus]
MKKTLYFLVSLFFLFSCFLSLVFSLDDLPKQCLDDQRSSLLQLQHDLYYAPNFTFSSKFELWDVNTGCCSWEGVTCDAFGHVIVLDLSYKNLSGSFHSIFGLRYLQHLNLAGNNFNTTLLSYGFDKLQHLTHLNLSSSCFHGQIPVEISFLSRLVSLDISNQDACYWRYYQFLHPLYYNVLLPYELEQPLKLENPDFKTLIKNLRNLTELYLNGVDISFQSSEWCETISLLLPNLQVLSLSNCGLKGPLCPSLSTLSFLSKLVLDWNPISYLPPNFLVNSSNMTSLSLVDCSLSGHFPTQILLLPKIQSIDISFNDQLMGQLPEFPSNNALRSLNLSSTNLRGKLPESIGNLKFLTDLILHGCHFFGPIPLSIANLSHLVNLDLEYNSFSGQIPPFHRFGVPNLAALLLGGNKFSGSINSSLFSLPSLRILSLGENQLVGKIDEFPNASSSLIEGLYLGNNYFTGPIPKSILQLPRLESLAIEGNGFSSLKLPVFGLLKNLRFLELSNISLLIQSDNRSLQYFPQLEALRLRSCNLTEFPEFIKTQDKLTDLDLSRNNIHGVVPNWLWKTTLLRVDLSFNPIIGSENPNRTSDKRTLTFPRLERLLLRSCNLTEFPKFIKTLDQLTYLDLSNNHIHGVVPNWLCKTTLLSLNLSFNPIRFPKQLPISDANFFFPMLRELYMRSCNISAFPELLRSLGNLERLSLSNNRISGAIPNWAWKKSLDYLDLSNNHLSSLDQLLSNQSLNSSQASLFRPICHMSRLFFFDASHNNFSGPIPNCLGNMSALEYLDLHGNNFSGILPDFSKSPNLWLLKVSENRLEGKLPRSLAECTQLEVLDVGNNMLRDTFPFWLEKLPALTVLVLRKNKFYGEIKHFKNKIVFPTLDVLDIASNEFLGKLSFDLLQATQLRSLKIGGNKFEGKLPRSLANCTKLEVLDLGNNMVHDAFPFWLAKLPSLKVLILRANRFYGTISESNAESDFPKLRILDIASNNFSGDLSVEFLQSLKAMTMITDGDQANKLDYIGERYYQDSLTIVNKGVELFYEKVLTILTCLDLSNNSFHGRIPGEIHILKALKVLNLSHNSFYGEIPSALDNLKDLESLDLSLNKLLGKIPPQLTSLTFLEALNLSYNQLEGNIPQSNQFGTFSNDSYLGNPKLCGRPLSRNCGEDDLPVPHSPREDKEDSWLDAMSTWKIALIGYASGLVAGLCIGYTVLNELGNKWVYKLKKHGERNRRRSR